ncbi:YigZ family protein [Cohnella yongneupensis]|uniref:YigZ family protein n=1 Tax=Cohnella yongneupensis TaxID=425006 RepID=A0ABW0R4G4_9BACL
MLPRYSTVRQYGSQEIVIKKSRFIGHAKPVATEEEAIAFIEELKKKYWDATHNCSAYMIGDRDQYQKALDDGEPSGTAGKPILEVIKHRGLKNIAVVVTRYFGGIMLGAGGLVRAYTDGAVAGIDAAVPIEYVLHREVFVDVDYTWYGKLENELRGKGYLVGDVSFTDRVNVLCLPEEGDSERFLAWITDVTQGQALLATGEAKYIAMGDRP